MPELPEVEAIRRGLLGTILGRRITAVTFARADIIRPNPHTPDPARLLAGCEITAIHRHGKQLALIGTTPEKDKRVVCIQLGMSGSLCLHQGQNGLDRHCHVTWSLDSPQSTPPTTLVFRDPRRFGGLRLFDSLDALHTSHWSNLGPDALLIRPRLLHRRLSETARPIKAALLDQAVLAGLGNIYVDELLFASRLHPLTPADTLSLNDVQHMVRRMRTLLHRAVSAGGSTFRDYRDAAGNPGDYQSRHRVYGRAGQPCTFCGILLQPLLVASRSTTFCPRCQPLPPAPSPMDKRKNLSFLR